MTQELLKILNPCRGMKVEDWLKMAEIIMNDDRSSEAWAIQLMERYEVLTSQPLTKEMFVSTVQKPTDIEYKLVKGIVLGDYRTQSIMDKVEEYDNAQEKVWFEGFEPIRNSSEVKILLPPDNKAFTVDVYQKDTFIKFFLQMPIYLSQATLFDFIYQVDLYNRTASTPINISFTEQFCQELLK